MRAITLTPNGLQLQQEYPKPKPAPREALVRVRKAGICNTDLELMKGYMGFSGVPGHEFVGTVEECEENNYIGKRVVGSINIGCRECQFCKMGAQNHCPNRSVLGILNKDGAFAEYLTLPFENLYIVPDGVDDEEAIFVEPLAAAFEILTQTHISPQTDVAVIGDGKLGLLTAQVLSLTGCNLVVIGKHPEKLATLTPKGIQIESDIRAINRSFHTVIECTGSEKGLDTVLQLVRPQGTIILKTTVADRSNINTNLLVINEITLLGSRCGPFQPALNALQKKLVDVRPLIHKRCSLEQGIDTLKEASQKSLLKVLIEIE